MSDRRLVMNSLSGTALYLVNVAVVFVMSPVYIKSLGNSGFGFWELVMSVVGYMGLLDLGVGGALVRFVSVADGRNDTEDMRETVSTAFAYCLGVGVLTMFLFLLIGTDPVAVIGKDARQIAGAGTIFTLLAVNSLVLFPQQVFVATLMGVQRHFFINCVRCVLTVCQASTAYWLLQRYHGSGLLVLAALQPVFNLVQLACYLWAVQADRTLPGITLRAVTRKKAKEIFTFGGKSLIMLCASRLQNQSIPFIIGNVIGLGQIVYFAVPNRLVDHAKGFSQAIGFPLTPYFGATLAKGDQNELVRSWLTTSMVLQIVSLAMPVIIAFYGESFLGLWLSREYAVAGRIVLYILIAGLLADSIAANAFRMLVAQGRHGACSLVWLVLAAASIPMGIAGARSYGVAGVAAGTTCAVVVANLVTLAMACHSMKVSPLTYFRRTVGVLLLPLLLLCGAGWSMSMFYPVTSYLDLVLQCTALCLVYLGGLWLFTIEANAKSQMKGRLKAIFA